MTDRLPGIEGLRALAASAVVLSHVWLYASPDGPVRIRVLSRYVFPRLGLGVTLFFAISGFLLFRPYAGAVLRGQPLPDARRYARNRFLRIVPAYVAVLLAVGVVFSIAVVQPIPDLRYGSLLDNPVVFAADLPLVQNYFPATVTTGLGATWSLAVEVVFYASLPALGLLAARLARRQSTIGGRRRAVLAPIAVLAIVGVLGRWIAAVLVPGFGPGHGWVSDWHSVIERSFLANADLFCFGMLVAVARIEIEDGRLRLPRWWPVVAGVAAALIGASAAAAQTAGGLHYYVYDELMSLALALGLSIVVLPLGGRDHGGRLVRLLERQPLVVWGTISYSVFLWNAPVASWLEEHGLAARGRVGFVANLVIVVVVTGVLSAISYRWVERPALRWKAPRSGSGSEAQLSAAQVEAAP